MTKRIIYISGPMSGIQNANREEFYKAEARLRAAGFVVLNPACLPDGLSYSKYMQIDMAMLGKSDAIYMLKGHQDSKGAATELRYAQTVELDIYYEESGDYTQVTDDLLTLITMTDGRELHQRTEAVTLG